KPLAFGILPWLDTLLPEPRPVLPGQAEDRSAWRVGRKAERLRPLAVLLLEVDDRLLGVGRLQADLADLQPIAFRDANADLPRAGGNRTKIIAVEQILID